MAVPNGRHLYYPARPPTFHLLEITLVSAQGLHKAPRAISTYASAWVDPAHKLYTRVDRVGLTDPTWNEKFVFRVDDAFLRSDTSGVDVHLHANHGRLFPLRDHLLGTVRVVLSTLRPVPGARRFVALQVRRPVSLRPQGILNIGVALLDPFARSMPLCCGIRSTSAYKDLIGVGEGDHRRSASEGCEGGRLERKRSVEVEGVEEEKEREELETKLEIWKADMSPDKYEGRNRIKKRSSIRRLSFFSCTTEMECSEEEKPTKVTIP